MQLTEKHVSETRLNELIAIMERSGQFQVLACLLELKQRRAEDRAKKPDEFVRDI